MIPSTTMCSIIEAYRDQKAERIQLKEIGYMFEMDRLQGDKECTEN